MQFDITKYNRDAWNRAVAKGDQWTRPVSPDLIERARAGDWNIVLTPQKPVPRDWFPDIRGKKVLCLAGGGGQQGPILAAAGAEVTVFDNSPAQLAQDRMVADREGLSLSTIEGDIRDLSCFQDETFHLIFHPCSNVFVPDIKPVWKEAARVLEFGGCLLAGFVNPVYFTMDPVLGAKGIAQMKYKIPYSDLESLNDEERKRYTDPGDPLEFGHSLEDQLGGQIEAGLVISKLFEDNWTEDKGVVHRFINCYMATKAIKLRPSI